ncbi:hypothetical protein OAU50_07080 [Planctomycetota bacterium]|nr:hypothetical protein [Planctomycetota bacterium]
MAAALFFMVVVTTAGAALLSSSTQNQLAIIERSVDVRLMIAVEAGVESVRGRFRLVEGIQDDWAWMAGATAASPYSLGTQSINGVTVNLTCWPLGSPSVPASTVRGWATASELTRYVEMDLKLATFSDFAMYLGESGQSHWGSIELYGRFHSNSDAHFHSAQTKFHLTPSFGMNGGSWAMPHNNTGRPASEEGPGDMNFNPHIQADVEIPENLVVYTAMRSQGLRTRTNTNDTSDNHTYYENTLEIQFTGDGNYRRIFVRRNANNTGTPIPPSWQRTETNFNQWTDLITTNDPELTGIYNVHRSSLSTSDAWLDNGGITNSSGTGGTQYYRSGLNVIGAPQNWYTDMGGASYGVVSGHWSVDNAWYDLCWESVPIPADGVIYMNIGSPDMYGSSDDSTSQPNMFTQRHVDFGDTSLNNPGTRNDSDRTPIVLLSGMLDNSRVTLVADGVNVVIRNNIIYKNNADDPSLREPANKESEAAVEDIVNEELLGVVSRSRMVDTADSVTQYAGRVGGGDINYAYRYWQHLGLASSNYGGFTLNKVASGDINQYCADGVFMGTHSCGTNYYHPSNQKEANSEVWFNGSLIAERCTYYCENAWNLVHYDWDFRLAYTTPPYFLRTYNTSARFVPGTWRSWSV